MELLEPGMVIEKPIIVWDRTNYLAAGAVLTEKNLAVLENLPIDGAYVQNRTQLELQDVFPALKSIEDGPAKNLYLKSFLALEEMMANYRLNCRLDVKKISVLVNRILASFTLHENLLIQLASLKSYDHYLITHSINVCIFSLFLGHKLKLDDKDLNTLGLGALLHDIGKMNVPARILNKPGKLTPAEYETIKCHTEEGYNRLKGNLPEESLRIIRDHHERCNGTGYPRKLANEEINLLTRCVAIADVYDALTTDRCYRKRMLPHDGMEVLMADSATESLDRNLVTLFLREVAMYPLGTTVKLSNGEIGVVTSIPKHFPMRPNVKIIDPAEKRGQIRRLLKNPSVLITDIIPPEMVAGGNYSLA